MDVTTTVDRYFHAWNQPDPQDRSHAVALAWAEDASYTDPNGTFNGQAAIADMIGAVQTAYRGVTFSRTSVIDTNPGDQLIRFSWAMRTPDGTPLLGGVDFGELADDGRIRRIVGFLGEAALNIEADAQDVIEASRTISAPREVVWPLLADHDAYGQIAPNLTGVQVVSGQGVGMVRQCANLQGQTWQETCTDWQEGSRYSFQIDTSTYPYPVAALSGTWAVDDHDTGSRITMRFHLQAADTPASRQFVRMLKSTSHPMLEAILDHWQQQAEAQTRAA